MTEPGQPITSHHTRLEWLAAELKRQLASPGATVVDEKSVVGWYLSYGYSLGLSRDELHFYLRSIPSARAVAERMSEDEIALGKPAPEFVQEQRVEVLVNAKNTTYHSGTVQAVTWHHKEGKWYFTLEENGKKVSKRYEARDLRAVVG